MATWITTKEKTEGPCPTYVKKWTAPEKVKKAELTITALGLYEALINGRRVGKFVLAPGWTSYKTRIQYQTYDVTDLLNEPQKENLLEVTVGEGWYAGPVPGWTIPYEDRHHALRQTGLTALLKITYESGKMEQISTDSTWLYHESKIRFAEIYDGETYDASFEPEREQNAVVFNGPDEALIPQEGEEIREMERVGARSVFTTPSGETIVDFGQEVTGYVEFTVNAKAGDQIHILHGEVLDKNGNFYNENYRGAKAEIWYTCKDGQQTWHPSMTYFGFRYLKLDHFPGKPDASMFTAICVYSNIRRTGVIHTGVPELNQLVSNIFWGQKDNYLDIPTDCPQRDERLGWTGDSQVFVKTGSYNYDIEKFFRKWLHDLKADQFENGGVGSVVPNVLPDDEPGAGWGDTAVISPWQIYQTYGNTDVLEDQFDSMTKWIDYITSVTHDPYLWTGGKQFGDWLGLDAPQGSYKGSSRDDFVASAYYAYSTQLVVKAGHALGKDVTKYEKLYPKIVEAFRKTYSEYKTQTECVLAVQFHLAPDPQKAADQLADMVKKAGMQMTTGFLGTPYILHVLSDYGYSDLAYTLLLRTKYPSWLYAVEHGATTIWEHWDGIMENGDFWSKDMNSFNHYAYGSVADWIYEEAAGIRHSENAAGFTSVKIVPHPDRRLGWLEASIHTRHGLIRSKWAYTPDGIRYEIENEMPAEIVIDGKTTLCGPGIHTFWTNKY